VSAMLEQRPRPAIILAGLIPPHGFSRHTSHSAPWAAFLRP
jgi:hypothetical protein